MFHFKQFSVNQQNCSMKINTDGVLLAAMAEVEGKKNVLDIGTGTGVIALMIAQRNEFAKIDALEIDEGATTTASENFKNSPYNNRITAYNLSFQNYFITNSNFLYDLIISNPPFFLNALKSKEEKKNLARHTNEHFFSDLMVCAHQHLTALGTLQIILPTQIEELIIDIAKHNQLYLHSKISISSFQNSEPIRSVLTFRKNILAFNMKIFHIYVEQGIHSEDYKNVLKDFFTIF
jgi:tRNA1Val (adenine37-N6)-methyltransferase